MEFPRASGLILHPTSLPGPFGIGDFGPEAYRFIDFLHAARQRIWQVLPLHPTGYGDSPFQCFSAVAGNPLLISLEKLVERGVLSPSDLAGAPPFPDDAVDYGAVMAWRFPLLGRAARNFLASAPAAARAAFEAYCRTNAAWLDDFALFMACKQAHGGRVWTEWPPEIARRHPAALQAWSRRLAPEIETLRYWQFEFDRQWHELRSYARRFAIRILGDLPMYVAHDSADVWAHPELFHLDEHRRPSKVAGVPPDYFSATGQLWGNPLYRWDVLARTGYVWWLERFRAALGLYDLVRLDHFRGFEAYWEVDAGEPTAVRGRWVKGPGAELFTVLQREFGELPIVAENLGVITPEVEALRTQFDFPGMAILQFAFGTDPQAPSFRPHNYPRRTVAYTGTHDNDTACGWWRSRGSHDSTRTPEDVAREHHLAADFLGVSDDRDIHWAMIRAIMASVADTAIFPLQDVLGLGSEARMNLPGRPNGNWRWRFRRDALTPDITQRLRALTELYNR